LDHRRIDDAAAVVDQMAAHQHSEHENPHIIVYFLFSVPDSLSVDKQHVYFFAILGLNWHGLIPNPKSLRKGRGLISYSKSIWLANQVVENVRLATTVQPSNCDHCNWPLNCFEKCLRLLTYNKLFSC
jgi:hypothetical protein